MSPLSENKPDPAVSVKKVGKTYTLRQGREFLMQKFFQDRVEKSQGQVQALHDISFDVKPGESVGILGRNGSGKSTLLGILSGIIRPTFGEIRVKGRLSAILELGAGFDPDFSGMENIYLSGSLLGYSRRQMDEKMQAILEFAEIGDFVHRPVKTYSSGMFVRLAFSLAINVEPEVLVIDEVLAVGDEAFQFKCFSRIKQMREKGITLVFVSHDSTTVMELADRVLMLEKGQILRDGPSREVVKDYLKLLFSGAAPPTNPEGAVAVSAQGLPNALAYASRGAFLSRPEITTTDGEKVSVLKWGREYIYTYEAHFARETRGVRFGMMIRTRTGHELGGMTSHPMGEGIPIVKENARVRPGFRFKCLLTPGKYFMNAGVMGIKNSEETYLHRMVDALMFTVAPEGDALATGFVDFSTGASVKVEGV